MRSTEGRIFILGLVVAAIGGAGGHYLQYVISSLAACAIAGFVGGIGGGLMMQAGLTRLRASAAVALAGDSDEPGVGVEAHVLTDPGLGLAASHEDVQASA